MDQKLRNQLRKARRLADEAWKDVSEDPAASAVAVESDVFGLAPAWTRYAKRAGYSDLSDETAACARAILLAMIDGAITAGSPA